MRAATKSRLWLYYVVAMNTFKHGDGVEGTISRHI